MAKYTFTLTVEHDDGVDPEEVGNAVDTLLETAMSTPGVLDDLGHAIVGPLESQLQSLLEQPDTDDATYVLREVYKLMGLPIPEFLET